MLHEMQRVHRNNEARLVDLDGPLRVAEQLHRLGTRLELRYPHVSPDHTTVRPSRPVHARLGYDPAFHGRYHGVIRFQSYIV